MAGNWKLGRDKYNNFAQFGHWNTANYKNVTTAEVFDATSDRDVDITPTTDDAWVKITAATNTPTADEGRFIPIGQTVTTIIRVGEYIGSTSEINVVALGEL